MMRPLIFFLQAEVAAVVNSSPTVDWTAIIQALFSLISALAVAWFAYNQKTKDSKIDRQKKEYTVKERRRMKSYAKIYGKMWKQLYSLDCDRLSIIQPHPLNKKQFLSIGIEVCKDGITTLKDTFNGVPMSDIPQFSGELEGRDFVYYKNLKKEAKDKFAIAKFSECGCRSIVIKKLYDEDDEWLGNILCEWCREKDLNIDYVKGQLNETASDIQYILPEYDETLKNE